jgi:hypothetical protein
MGTANTVAIACRLPHGFVLQAQEKFTVAEPTQSDPSRKVERSRFTGPKFRVAGFAVSRDPADERERQTVVAGYGITPDVPKTLWDAFLRDNEDWEPIAKGLVKAFPSEDRAKGYARAGGGGVFSGLEAIKMTDLPAEFAGKVKADEKK